MPALFGIFSYAFGFLPAVTLALFVWLISRSTRQDELVEMFRFSLQAFVGVTSPVKMGAIVMVLMTLLVAGWLRPARWMVVLVAGAVGLTLLGHLATIANVHLLFPVSIESASGMDWACRA